MENIHTSFFILLTHMDGILRCSRYAFGPNRLHYCGPDANHEMAAHIDAKAANPALEGILAKFETMYPYLQLIARANRIADPFDARVVEAYWLGNDLLDAVSRERLYWHVKDDLRIATRIGNERFGKISNEMAQSETVPHHAFHVLQVWEKGVGLDGRHTKESIGECLVNAGEVVTVSGPWLTVRTRPLLTNDQGQWYFGEATDRQLTRQLGAADDLDDVAIGARVSYHWGVPCEVITEHQARNLERYTMQSIVAVNSLNFSTRGGMSCC